MPTGRSYERQRDPAALAERLLHGVDDFLHPSAAARVGFIAIVAAQRLADEAGDQVGVEERAPRLARRAAVRVEARRHLELAELDRVRRRRAQRLADPALLDQPADERALAPVHP